MPRSLSRGWGHWSLQSRYSSDAVQGSEGQVTSLKVHSIRLDDPGGQGPCWSKFKPLYSDAMVISHCGMLTLWFRSSDLGSWLSPVYNATMTEGSMKQPFVPLVSLAVFLLPISVFPKYWTRPLTFSPCRDPIINTTTSKDPSVPERPAPLGEQNPLL